METTVNNKMKALVAIVIFTVLQITSLRSEQLFVDTGNIRFDSGIIDEVILNDQISIRETSEQSQKSGSDYLASENFSALLQDTLPATKNEKIVEFNSQPENEFNQIESKDSTKYNMFGHLLNDDIFYNKKYPIWIPIAEVLGVHAFLSATNMYAFNEDFAKIGFNSWNNNVSTAWEWDIDRFGMNFLGHPYSGGLNFMSARSNGYNFWESAAFAVGGSLMWEYFGENTLVAYNDLVNTPVSGIFYGEVLYRLSSNILDDRTVGADRFLREFGAAILSPTRFFNRLIQGKLTRTTTKEVYQKEPINVELSSGVRTLNEGSSFGTGPQNVMFNLQIDYGYPFEHRYRKPYDFFTVRTELNFGVGRKVLGTLSGYGVIFGSNVKTGDLDLLIGLFQHYNYFDNVTFELGAIAIGGGVMSKFPINDDLYIYTNIHLGIVPLAGNSTHYGPDTTQFRDYNYGGGTEVKLESGINFTWASLQFIGYHYWIHTYYGIPGDNYIALIKPRISIQLYRNLSIGFEHLTYYSDRYTDNLGDFHQVRTEQKIYLTLNVGNLKLK